MTTALRSQLQSTLGDGYTIERELAGGGMSRVYVVEDAALHRRIVVKVLRLELAGEVSLARFQREIALAASLQHPHIVPLLASGDMQGLPYYTMPFVDGESLRERLARSGELPVAEAVRLLREIATALAYAHEKGIVHRDIKPENVLLSGGIALVADFGVAKALIASTTAASGPLTSVGIAVGTPAYMSPEQVSADPDVDHRADLYSFGMVAYEMLAGQPPFAGRTGQSLLSAHVIDTPESLMKRRPATPPALAAIVMRCLEKRPADRPQSAAEIIASLDVLTTPAPPAAPSGTTNAVPSQSSRRRVSATVIRVCISVLVAAIGAGWFVVSRRGTTAVSAPRLLIAPFENLTGDPTLDYVGRLAADQLATAVGQVGSTDVVASNLVFSALRDTTLRAADQLKRLSDATHASLVVSGTYARRGDSLAVTAQVTETRTGTLVHTFDPATKPLANPSDAVTQLGDHLLGWLNVRGITALPQRGFRAPNAAAYQEFAKAYELTFLKRRPGEARPFLERAIALDSTYVRAYLMLFGAYFRTGDTIRADSILRRVERLPQQLTAGEQALLSYERATLKHDLQGQLQGQSRLAGLDSSLLGLQGVGDFANQLLRPDLAVPALERGLALASVIGGQEARTFGIVLAQAYHQAGAHERELSVVRDLRAKVPGTGALAGSQLRAYGALARGGTAALALADTMAREANDSIGDVLVFIGWGAREFRAHGDTATAGRLLGVARAWMTSHPAREPSALRQMREGVILYASGMTDSAVVRFEASSRDSGQREYAIGYLALASASLGDQRRARAVADSLGHLPIPSATGEFWRAAIFGALGDKAQAVQLLRKANSLGQPMTAWHDDFPLVSLHGYPEFEELVRPKH